MKYLTVFGLFVLASFASCYVLEKGDEAFGAAVHLLNKTLNALAETKEGPSFHIIEVSLVSVLPYYEYPTLTADLKDPENKVHHCDVTINKALDPEDFTTEYGVEFNCNDYQAKRNVTVEIAYPVAS